jgi:hypothetical protein
LQQDKAGAKAFILGRESSRFSRFNFYPSPGGLNENCRKNDRIPFNGGNASFQNVTESYGLDKQVKPVYYFPVEAAVII